MFIILEGEGKKKFLVTTTSGAYTKKIKTRYGLEHEMVSIYTTYPMVQHRAFWYQMTQKHNIHPPQ